FRQQLCGGVATRRGQLRQRSAFAYSDGVCRQGFASTEQVGPSERLEQFCAFARLELERAQAPQHGYPRWIRDQLFRSAGFPGLQHGSRKLPRELVERYSDDIRQPRLPRPREGCCKSKELVPFEHEWFSSVPTSAAEWCGQPDGYDLRLCG